MVSVALFCPVLFRFASHCIALVCIALRRHDLPCIVLLGIVLLSHALLCIALLALICFDLLCFASRYPVQLNKYICHKSKLNFSLRSLLGNHHMFSSIPARFCLCLVLESHSWGPEGQIWT